MNKVNKMSKKKKESPYMPVTGAGLIRFFEEEIRGIKVTPIQIVVFVSIFMILVILGNMGVFTFIKI
ncbi:MAG: preprotein translocase subunit Sec61beta [Candidatus Methanomethylicia archaeon]